MRYNTLRKYNCIKKLAVNSFNEDIRNGQEENIF